MLAGNQVGLVGNQVDASPGLLTCIALVVALLAVFVFAGSEGAVSSLGEPRIRRLLEARKGPRRLLELWLREPVRVVTTLLAGATVARIAAATLTALLALGLARHAGLAAAWHDVAIVGAAATLSLIVLAVCELAPRTLIIADKGSYVSYLEGCTAPMRDENQLHAAVVELIALDDAEIKYSTVQNWYPGDAQGKGGIYNFVTKRGACRGVNSKISWTQVETGSAITWKYPSCILQGDNSVGEFYSIAITNNCQQADTGTKMIHLGRNTRSRIVSKGISAGRASQTYRGLVRITPGAEGARNHTQCDSLLIGDACAAHTVPYIESKNASARIEHEATTSKIGEDQLFYCRQRGISQEDAVALVVNGFCREVLQQLPMEFAVEAQKLVGISLEGSVG